MNKIKMLKILKPKIIFVNWRFKITLNNDVIKIITAVCKEILFYSQWWLQEADFLDGDGDSNGDAKLTEGGSSYGGDVNDACGGDGKRKVGCEG